jgi:hypothetical protein
MTTVTRSVRASASAVFAVLADGWLYSNWVVGTSHMRAVEAAWPSVGARIHHASGLWPLVMRDESVVEDVIAERRLVLIARGRPFGEARVVIELGPGESGTLVTMEETPVAGPGKWAHNPISEALLVRRNVEALARLAALVERRTEPGD